jgi:hypothetical protein
MEDDIVLAGIACYGFLAMAGAVQIHQKRRRSIWCKPWIVERPVSGAYSKLFNDLRNTDETSYKNFIRMDLAALKICCHELNL